MEDSPARSHDSKGNFSVRSAYKMLAGKQLPQPDGDSSSGVGNNLNEFDWKLLWSQACAPKTKQFLWRLAHDSLPWKLNFKRRGMEPETVCPMCNKLDEDRGGGTYFFTANKLNLWQWWTARNKRNAKDGSRSVAEVASQSRRWAGEFALYLTKPRVAPNHDHGDDKWERPVNKVMKNNTDGAFSDNPRRGGWGFVVRDSDGVVASSGAGKMAFPTNVVHTEAEACIQGLIAAMNRCMTRVVIKSDCQVLVNTLNKEEYDRSPIGVIVRDAHIVAGLNFTYVSFSFCRRNCNKVTHAMAAMGASGDAGFGLLWPDDVPNDVAGVVAGDIVMPVG
ncbi:hypothetical protein D1007_25194 [Hordeum vulgare]|nr:hypothetical protein D1007_25194 [Hordeum vulgare]